MTPPRTPGEPADQAVPPKQGTHTTGAVPSDEQPPSRRSFLRAAGLAAAGAAAGGLSGAAIGSAVGIEGARLDFAPERVTARPGFEHLIVVMYENRSFDNVLGWLYTDANLPKGATFDGLAFGDYSNLDPETGATIPAQVYTGGTDEIMSSPHPDPGEAFPHVNTQLFGSIDPASNADLAANGLKPPFNRPPDGARPTMSGFAKDFRVNFDNLIKNKRKPTAAEMSVSMGGFSPEMLPVFSTLAKEFAVYDHWHCAVPSQTFCNRSFFHASTSHGYVTNEAHGGYQKWLDRDLAASPTVFNRLEEAGVSWRVYYDKAQLVSMTGVLHAPVIEQYWKSNFRTMEQFYADAENGTLPAYSFIEPRMVYNHNDMHPPFGVLRESPDGSGGEVIDGAVSDVRAGELLLHNIYSAVKASASPGGSNALNTMLLVTFDEHGGTYDHVPPPETVPPVSDTPGEMGFRFNRLGCRVPAIAISAYTAKNTIINQEMHHASVISTLSKLHGLKPLTFRDRGAPDLFSAVNLATPRAVSDWPTTVPQFVPPNPEDDLDPTSPEHEGKRLSNPATGLLGLLLSRYGAEDEPLPQSYSAAYSTLIKHGDGLFGTTDGA